MDRIGNGDMIPFVRLAVSALSFVVKATILLWVLATVAIAVWKMF